MAHVIAIASSKGGVGKTTCAVNLAAVLGKDRRVLLVDADPQNAGSAQWWIGDNESFPFDTTKSADPALLEQLRNADTYDLVIVDTRPALDSELLAAVSVAADLTIIPAQPGTGELLAAIETLKALPPTTDVRVLLTMIDSRAMSEAINAQNVAANAGVTMLRSFVRSYKAHTRARDAHVMISDVSDRNRDNAASDFDRVAAELMELLPAQSGETVAVA